MNMAEAGNQIQKLTECCICLKPFNDPRMLPCIHTFCLECLKQTCQASTEGPQKTMSCPLCKKLFAIPADGLDGLQKNLFMEHLMEVKTKFQLSNLSAITCDICKDLYEGEEKTKTAMKRCWECKDNFCDICARAHKLQKLSKDHNIVNIGSEMEEDMRRISPTRNCTDHNQKPLDYYCPKCKEIVCISCVLENHASHECKDVSTVESEFRQTIERNVLKISIYADEMLSEGKRVEQGKENILLQLAEKENEVRKRNLELKKMIDSHTESLLDELSRIKQKKIKDCENEKEEIERSHTVLKSFETYCKEIRTKGSASNICSCVEELVARTDELEKDHEAFIGRLCQSSEISFKPTDLTELLNNIVGRIQETTVQESCMVITGLNQGYGVRKDVCKLNLHRPNEILDQQQIPTEMQEAAVAAVYCNTMYVTGMGLNYEEIWKYNLTSGWVKCASLDRSRSAHCVEFLDEVLYICGGFGYEEESPIDSVEAYNAVVDKCTTVGNLVHCVESSGNCVPFKNSLYIFGGKDKDYNAMNHVQVYDTKQNTCTLLSKPMPRPCFLMPAALWDTSAILVGKDTCFIFNFETETWQERERFKTDVVNFALVLHNERVFVIGGDTDLYDEDDNLTYLHRDDVRYVPLKSIIDDRWIGWKNYAKLEKPGVIFAYGKMCFPAIDGN